MVSSYPPGHELPYETTRESAPSRESRRRLIGMAQQNNVDHKLPSKRTMYPVLVVIVIAPRRSKLDAGAVVWAEQENKDTAVCKRSAYNVRHLSLPTSQ